MRLGRGVAKRHDVLREGIRTLTAHLGGRVRGALGNTRVIPRLVSAVAAATGSQILSHLRRPIHPQAHDGQVVPLVQ